MAALPDHGFVVVWAHAFGSTERAITGQFLDGSGAFRGAEFQIVGGSEWATRADVAADDRGGFVVAWQVTNTSGVWRIAARRFDATGAPVGAVFAVTTGSNHSAERPRVAMQARGEFVIVWASNGQDGSQWGIFGRRFEGAGEAVGGEFRVSTYTSLDQLSPSVAADDSGRFVVVWQSTGQDGSGSGIFGQGFLRDGTRSGAEFQVNSYTTDAQFDPHVMPGPGAEFVVVWRSYTAADDAFWARRFGPSGAPQGPDVRLQGLPGFFIQSTDASVSRAGDFAVVWDRITGTPPMGFSVTGARFDATGAPRGQEFLIDDFPSFSIADDPLPSVASDANGNLLVAWRRVDDVHARRYGGLLPSGVDVSDGGNGILELGDVFTLATSWRNVNGAPQTFQSGSAEVSAPAGVALRLSADADYDTVGDGATGSCSLCFMGTIGGTRPAGHVDTSFLERIRPDVLGQTQRWVLHLGDSFTDVPRANPFYRFVETLLHHGVTGGCSADAYCPSSSTTREQMAPFVLIAKEGAGYAPPVCGTPAFPDVPSSSPFCRWIEELARRGVVGGCGGGNYCPSDAVTREQMAVFVLRTLDPALDPPACTTPMFADVPASSPFCRWIEELARRGVVTGCGGGNYCPTAAVTREQMGVFISATFGLNLYGP